MLIVMVIMKFMLNLISILNLIVNIKDEYRYTTAIGNCHVEVKWA